MAQQIPKHASGFAVPLTEPELRYTNPDLHRRIDNDVEIPPYISGDISTDSGELIVTDNNEAIGVVTRKYKMVAYDENGAPYLQRSKVGILDGMHSFRVVDIFVHDEESTTCEIP